ncbi:MAG TPA: hypothetical protein VNE58_00300 [Casimicrobiaceae bacterium]|nr:hypothetical protein [Casimicrobiaceae bacterium]
MQPRVALVHVVTVAIPPVSDAIARDRPEVRVPVLTSPRSTVLALRRAVEVRST